MKLTAALSALAIASPAAATEAPWDALSSSLSSPDALTVPAIEAFVEECTGTFLSDPTVTSMLGTANVLQAGSNWQLVDQPSKLCADTLTCAFQDCILPSGIVSFEDESMGPDAVAFFFNDTLAAIKRHEDHLAFPDRVLHPASVADVVAAMKWANANGVPVTVKTTGHHYTGASTRKGTLGVSTRSLPAYAATSIMTCADVAPDDDSYLGGACRLAIARGKTAAMRAGGGELWDAVLQSALKYNEDPANADGEKYIVMSGASGTVSAAGGWLASGGNSAVRGQRTFGLGVDQVLAMEMVLPDGTHVRFGPEEWEDAPNHLYPKTISVKGYCNENPVAAEDEWDWKSCDVVDFNELWMAARGGGGGTWGILTSLVYQLHPRPVGGTRGMKFLPLTDNADAWSEALANETLVHAFDDAVEDFKLSFYLDPSSLNVAEEDSNACGCDWTTYPHLALPPWGPDYIDELTPESTCMGEKASEAWVDAWRAYLSEGGAGRERLAEGGFSDEQVDEIAGWAYGSDWREDMRSKDRGPLLDFPAEVKARFGDLDDASILERTFITEDWSARGLEVSMSTPNPGRLPDDPLPYVFSGPRYAGGTTTIISTEKVLANREDLVPFLAEFNRMGEPHYIYGGNILNGHDQMTAIPASRREGGLYMHHIPKVLDQLLPMMFGDLDPASDPFPGFVGHNHNVRHGPLKEDWTKACPLSFGLDEMDEKCVSEQEAVWGTELLARLEKFKAEIDPGMIMTCATGVGYERTGGKAANGGGEAVPGEEGNGAGSGGGEEGGTTDSEGNGETVPQGSAGEEGNGAGSGGGEEGGTTDSEGNGETVPQGSETSAGQSFSHLSAFALGSLCILVLWTV